MSNFDSSFNRTAVASSLVTAAERSAEVRNWEQADALFQEAISFDDSSRSRIAYGVYLFRCERFNEAISALTPVLDGSDLLATGIVCHNLAAIYREVGDFDLARRFQWRSTLLQSEADSESLLAMTNDALAIGCLDAAVPLVTAAADLSSDSADHCRDGDVLATRGLVQAIAESPRQGLMTLFSAYRLHQSHRDILRMGTDLLNMAYLFGALGRYKAEKMCLQRAIHCFHEAKAPDSLGRAQKQLERNTRSQLLRSFDGQLN